jgi:penicillin amidase
MTFADRSGKIGQLTAARLPKRSSNPPSDMVNPPGNGWDSQVSGADLPHVYAPEAGFAATANARVTSAETPIGFHFSPPDRLRRLNRLLGETAKLGVEDFMKIHEDVHSEFALLQNKRVVSWISEISPLEPETRRLRTALEGWNGDYDADSRGALAFELILFHLSRRFVSPQRLKAYETCWATRNLAWDDICAADAGTRKNALSHALQRASADFANTDCWGSRHRLALVHFLGAIPFLRQRYRLSDDPVSGSSETLMKTAHPLTNRRHSSSYGSVARHISDMSDDDANYFVLLGGQDGWFKSTTYADQSTLWKSGLYVQVPLRIEKVRAEFPFHTTISP